MKWLPLADAAKQMGLSVAALVEAATADEFELPIAVKCDSWSAELCREGHRKLLEREPEGPPAQFTADRKLDLAGYYRLYRVEAQKFALRWPEPMQRCELLLWRESAPDDIYWLVGSEPVAFESVFVDAEAMNLLADKIDARLREGMLRLIGVLAQAAGIDPRRPIDPIAKLLIEWCKAADAPLSKNTIKTRLGEAFELVKRVDFQQLPKISNTKT